MAQAKINKVVKGLKKASKSHAKQAKTLESIKMGKGGSAEKPKRDACYKHVVKQMPQNSAYRSGHMVKCRNAGGPSNYPMGGSRQKKSGGGPVSSRGQGIVMASKRR